MYKGLNNITIHILEHDILLTQDIIYDFLTTGNKSPVVKLIPKDNQSVPLASL